MSFDLRVYHYAIDNDADQNLVSIEGGKKFAGPVELINYHKQKKRGMVVLLRVAYNRPLHQESPYVWFGVTKTEFENIIEREVSVIFMCSLQGVLDIFMASESQR